MGSYEQLNNIPDGFFHKLILHQNKWNINIYIYNMEYRNQFLII